MPTRVFEGSQARCTWTGTTWTEGEIVAISSDITDRVLDLTFERNVAEMLQDLDKTRASSQWLKQFLEEAVSHDVVPWQVGEAIAETVLKKEHQVIFPWNTKRDERNPRSSLPGADLVGISVEPGGHRLVFGEVKSSSDKSSPPSVVTGKNGMNQQLERLAGDDKLRLSLIKWLFAHVHDQETCSSLKEAFAAFVETRGASVRLVGMLVRDTDPSEDDVNARGRSLGEKVTAPGSVELHAMYIPRPMAEWIKWVAA